jgi:hypothetical protein
MEPINFREIVNYAERSNHGYSTTNLAAAGIVDTVKDVITLSLEEYHKQLLQILDHEYHKRNET